MKWKREILNSFTRLDSRRISNGPIESRNNIIKLLIRNAAGYRNLDTLRLRVLYVLSVKKKKDLNQPDFDPSLAYSKSPYSKQLFF